MIDCPNAEMRDRLPDLLQGRLEPEMRSRVAAHVASCSACAAELRLLRELRSALRTPEIDVSRVVSVLPSPGGWTRDPADPRARLARRWLDWRVAAAVAAIVIGLGSTAVRERARVGSAPERVATVDFSVDAYLGEASAVEVETLVSDRDGVVGWPPRAPEPALPPPADGEVPR